jgi:hypothetical protein
MGLGVPASKAVPARAADPHLESPAAHGLRHRRVDTGAIQHDVRGDAPRPVALPIKLAHAAQVAFALFAHIAQEDQRRRQFHRGLHQRMRDSQHPHYACRIVACARSLQPSGSVAIRQHRIQRRSRRKNRVEVSRQHHHRPGALFRNVRSRQRGKDVARRIRMHARQSRLGKTRRQPLRSRLLAEGRRGNSDQLHLPVHQFSRVLAQPRKGRMHRPLAG